MKQTVLAMLILLAHICSYAQHQGRILKIDDIHVACVNQYFDECFSQQEKENWCWAACIQMVLKYQGIRVSQSEIAKRTFGDNKNATANGYDIINSINGWHIEKQHIIANQDYKIDFSSLAGDLAYKYPVIIGLKNTAENVGHAVILTHLYYKTDHSGKIYPYKAVCADPAKSYKRELIFEWADFYQQINTIVHIYLNQIL